jgi:hypothetical protein
MFNNKQRAFYNSASHIQLNTLPREETINYLYRQFSTSRISIDRDNALLLIEEAGDIPYYIQLLAAEVWQYMINSEFVVTFEIIKFCSNKIIELKQDYYFELFDRQSVLQKKLLKALVINGENVFSSDYIKRFRLSATSSVQKAIVVLMDNGLIDRIANNYFISDPFFRRYIENYA